MKRWQVWGFVSVILLAAAALRLTGIDWDDYQHYHPDERYITWVATTIEWPATWRTAFDPAHSSFNPFYWPPEATSTGIEVLQDQHRDFAYGHVPLYLGVLATRFVEAVGPPLASVLPAEWLFTQDLLNGAGAIEFRHLTAVARALTALFDVGTVFLVYLLAKRVYNTPTGLLAAALLAVNVMHIQLAHFFISDPFLTFFVVAAVFFMVLPMTEGGSPASPKRTSHTTYTLLLASFFVGLAVGSKFTAVLLFLPLALTVYMTHKDKWPWWLGTAVLTTCLTFFITNPFAILDVSCEVITPASAMGPVTIPALDWRSCYLENVVTQGAMVRGRSDVAFTRQYLGTQPYLFFVEMQLRWGMGWLLGLAAFGGLAWAVWRGSKQFGGRQSAELIMLAWVVPYFLLTGSFLVKFMRYLQPVTPFLMIYAAAMLLGNRQQSFRNKIALGVADSSRKPQKSGAMDLRKLFAVYLNIWGSWVKRGVVTAVLLFTTLYALSFVNLYRQPHPWNMGSVWVYEHVPPGALILSEQWDDALPATMLLDGQPRRRSEYRNQELTWLTGAGAQDDEAKLEQNLARLAAGDYLTIMSNRVYGVVPRLPERYPLSGQYHQLLFDGALGYEPVYVAARLPSLYGWRLFADRFGWPGLQPPDVVETLLAAHPTLTLGRADESFTVYDQPLLIIFQNTGHLTAVEMRLLFNSDAD